MTNIAHSSFEPETRRKKKEATYQGQFLLLVQVTHIAFDFSYLIYTVFSLFIKKQDGKQLV